MTILPEDADRALRAWELAESEELKHLCAAIVQEYLAELIRPYLASAVAQNIANGK